MKFERIGSIDTFSQWCKENPNKEPYRVAYYSIEGVLKRIPQEKLRSWLQAFSLGYKYGKNEVRGVQIQACYDNNKVGSWLLWNPRCIYTKDALKDKNEEHFYIKSDSPTPQMLKTANKKLIFKDTSTIYYTVAGNGIMGLSMSIPFSMLPLSILTAQTFVLNLFSKLTLMYNSAYSVFN